MPVNAEFKFTKLDEISTKRIETCLTSRVRKGYVKCDGFLVPELLPDRINEIINLEIYDDDIWVCSFQKSGTTWTQEMAWSIINNDLYEYSKRHLSSRYTFLDTCFMFNSNVYSKQSGIPIEHLDSVNALRNKPRPRFIKTHLPYQFLPVKLRNGSTKAKIIYVSRNPRDACISYFHHRKLLGSVKCSMEEFCELYLDGLVSFGPYWKHIRSYCDQKNNTSLLTIRFEDMKKNLPDIVNRVAKFFGKHLNEEDVQKLCAHLSFESMKINPAVNSDPLTEMVKRYNNSNQLGSFIRSGNVNEWKSVLSSELIQKFEQWEQTYLVDV